MTGKHTPGPWQLSANGPEIFAGGSTFRVGPLATVYPRNDGREQRANAALIAAAPELLDACRAAFRVLDHSEALHLHQRDKTWGKLGQAILKAEGCIDK